MPEVVSTNSAVETTVVPGGMLAPVIVIPGCTPMIEGLPVMSVLVFSFPVVVSVKPETSNQPNFVVPPGNPGWVTMTRPATCVAIGGVQSPELACVVGVLPLVIPPTGRKIC